MCHFSLLLKGNIFCGKDAGWLGQRGIPQKTIPKVIHVLGGNNHGC